MAKLTDHNHICDQGRVLKWLLYEELEKIFFMDLMQKPSEVRKKADLGKNTEVSLMFGTNWRFYLQKTQILTDI